jgi:transcription antitermination protein NusB
MNADRHIPIVPARVTVEELATAIGRSPDEVREVLAAGRGTARPEQSLDAEDARHIAQELGVAIAIEARDQALEMLYQWEMTGELPEPDSLTGRVGHLVEGVIDNCEALDLEIESISEHWSVARMPVLDRSILRIGLFELRHDPGTPAAVAVSEALRLAQTYSTEKSGSFVNGVLGSLARSGGA